MTLFPRPVLSALLVATLLALLPAGCSKESSSLDGSAPSAAAHPNVADLGVLELGDNEPLRIELREGRTAVVTAKVLPDGSLEIATEFLAPVVDGKRQVLGTPRMITKPGRPVEVAVGDVGLKFTPQVKRK